MWNMLVVPRETRNGESRSLWLFSAGLSSSERAEELQYLSSSLRVRGPGGDWEGGTPRGHAPRHPVTGRLWWPFQPWVSLLLSCVCVEMWIQTEKGGLDRLRDLPEVMRSSKRNLGFDWNILSSQYLFSQLTVKLAELKAFWHKGSKNFVFILKSRKPS